MAVKLLTWDIKSGRKAEFLSFKVHRVRFAEAGPVDRRLVYDVRRASPQIMIGGTAAPRP
jgi:hypothetical protein